MAPEAPQVGDAGADFYVGEWLVRPTLNHFVRNGSSLHVRPRAMDVLVFLARRAGEVVPKDAIIDGVWAKQYVTESALSAVICELREALGDDSQNPTFIETIPKRGYRLLAPTRTVSVAAEQPAPTVPESPPARPAAVSSRRWALGTVALLAVIVATTLFVLGRKEAPADRSRPRLIVLPFENLGAPDDAYFTAGITDEITGRLAAIPGIAVISRNSAVRYATGEVSAARLAAELDVDYVLRGTVQWGRGTGTGKLRITTRLIRASDDTHLWGAVYDRDVEDIFVVQSDVARNVAHQLNLRLVEKSSIPTQAPTPNPDAYKSYLQGNYHLRSPESEEDQLMAIRLYERAVELDPSFTLAQSALARAYAMRYQFGFSRTPREAGLAVAAAQRATALAPGDPDVELTLAIIDFTIRSNPETAFTRLSVLEATSGTSEQTLRWQGYCLRRLGRFEEARQRLLLAADLNPYDSWLQAEIGITHTILGQWEAADRYYRRSIELTPDQHTAYEWRAHNLLLWGRPVAEAKEALAKMPPLSRPTVIMEWWQLELCDRNYDAALQQLDRLPEIGCTVQFHFYPRALMAGEVYRLRGDTTRARAAFEQAREVLEREAAASPLDPRMHSALGLAYAGLGRRAEAVREGEEAVRLSSNEHDAVRAPFCEEALARIHLMTGDVDAAAAIVARLKAQPLHPHAVPMVGLDPRWDALRGHPLLAGGS